MKYLLTSLPQIKKRLKRAGGAAVFLDFDGTLAKIAPRPSMARLPRAVKIILKKISRRWPLAIISGRALADIKAKVGLVGPVYGGNHGLEWQMRGRTTSVKLSVNTRRALARAKAAFKNLAGSFPGVLLEDKTLAFSAHYRLLSPAQKRKFLSSAEKTIALLKPAGLLKSAAGKQVLEIQPNINWDKGKLIRLILSGLNKKQNKRPLPLFIGDDVTDEHAFLALKSGVTISVGQNPQSSARYFVKNPREVREFLAWLNNLELS